MISIHQQTDAWLQKIRLFFGYGVLHNRFPDASQIGNTPHRCQLFYTNCAGCLTGRLK